MASAHALMGQSDTAREALNEVKRLMPFATVGTMTFYLSVRGLPIPFTWRK